jgi:hypothetical protein
MSGRHVKFVCNKKHKIIRTVFTCPSPPLKKGKGSKKGEQISRLNVCVVKDSSTSIKGDVWFSSFKENISKMMKELTSFEVWGAVEVERGCVFRKTMGVRTSKLV